MERISFRVKFLKAEITLRDSACQLAGKVRTCLLKTFLLELEEHGKAQLDAPFKPYFQQNELKH